MDKKMIIIGKRKDDPVVEIDAQSMPEHEVIAEGEKWMRIYGMKIPNLTVVDGVVLPDPTMPRKRRMRLGRDF